MSFRLVPKSVTLNDLERRSLMDVALHYFTDIGKPAFQHITASNSGGIYARIYCVLYCVYDIVVKRSRSLSHHLVSLLFILVRILTFYRFYIFPTFLLKCKERRLGNYK